MVPRSTPIHGVAPFAGGSTPKSRRALPKGVPMSLLHTRWLQASAFAALAALGAAAQAERMALPPGQASNAAFKIGSDGVGGFAVADGTTTTPTQLVQSLLGPGVTATNVTLTGPLTAVGSFTGGLGSVGLDHGVVLSSGAATSVLGPNVSDTTSTDNGTPGSSMLNAFTTSPTYDACILEFDFVAAAADTISFQYVFSSEEYDEWVNTAYNDVFAFVLNGQNIALLPSGPPRPTSRIRRLLATTSSMRRRAFPSGSPSPRRRRRASRTIRSPSPRAPCRRDTSTRRRCR
jgi:hypothetical protein